MAAGLPTSVAVEVEFTAGVWTAITTDVRGESLEIKGGRTPGGDVQPGTCTFDLDNIDGKYTPDNPLSSLYPNLVEGKRVRVVVVKGGSTSYRFVGWITVLESELAIDPTQSSTHVEAVDVLGMVARMQPGGASGAYALNNPDTSLLYLMDEADVYSSGCRDRLSEASPALWPYEVDPENGSLDSASDAAPGDVPVVKLTQGRGLRTNTAAFSPKFGGNDAWSITAKVKIEGEVFQSSLFGHYVFGMSSSKAAGTFQQRLGVVWTSSFGFGPYGFGIGWTDQSTGTTTTFWSSAEIRDPDLVSKGRWYHVTLSGDGAGTVTLKVNGYTIQTESITLNPGLTHLIVGGGHDMSIGTLAVNTTSDAECYSARSAVAAEASGGATVSDVGDDLAVATGLAALDAGFVQAAGFDPQSSPPHGDSGLEMFLNLARGQGGVIHHEYTAADPQQLRIVPRDLTRPTAVALTLDAEADLDGPPTLLREVGRLAATATASSATRSATATDAASGARVGEATVSVESTLYELVELHGQASDALSVTRDQKLRLSQVRFDLATAENNLYAAWFATSPGERVRVSNLPSTFLGVTYMDGYVAGWTEWPLVTGYPVLLDLEPADAPREARFDTARWAWGDGVCTASSLTAGATSVTLTWTGGQLLSTSAGDYPMDIDIGGERCTITSAPAGGSSPRTVTISRGVAPTVARAHAAGDPVEVWDAARWAF